MISGAALLSKGSLRPPAFYQISDPLWVIWSKTFWYKHLRLWPAAPNCQNTREHNVPT